MLQADKQVLHRLIPLHETFGERSQKLYQEYLDRCEEIDATPGALEKGFNEGNDNSDSVSEDNVLVTPTKGKANSPVRRSNRLAEQLTDVSPDGFEGGKKDKKSRKPDGKAAPVSPNPD